MQVKIDESNGELESPAALRQSPVDESLEPGTRSHSPKLAGHPVLPLTFSAWPPADLCGSFSGHTKRL